MSNWWSTLASDLYAYVGALLSPAMLHQHLETALTSWPLALVVIAFAFRQQLIKLISSMRRLSYKDGSREIFASWEEGLQELKEIEEATEAEERLPSPRQTNDFDKLLALAKVNSRSAVIEAWLSVENAARELVEPFHKGSRPLGSPFMVERELWQRELIGPGEREILTRLRTLRNQASHMQSFQITEHEAAAYIDTALSLTARLNYLKEQQ